MATLEKLRTEKQPTRRLALSKTEAAEALGCSVDFLEEHVWPELRIVRRGQLCFVAVTELQAWLDREAERDLVNTPPGYWYEPLTGKQRRATRAELQEANRLLAKHRDIATSPTSSNVPASLEDVVAGELDQLCIESLGEEAAAQKPFQPETARRRSGVR